MRRQNRILYTILRSLTTLSLSFALALSSDSDACLHVSHTVAAVNLNGEFTRSSDGRQSDDASGATNGLLYTIILY